MLTITLKRIFSVCLSVIITICLSICICNQFIKKRTEKDLLNMANSIVNLNTISLNSNIISVSNNCETELYTQNVHVQKSNNVIGKIIIKDINVEAPVMEGTSQDILKISVGHFEQTSYWDGNVALASHNRGSYAHYFKNINKLNIGQEIVYQTSLGTRTYLVTEVVEISEYDLSVLKNTNLNTLTLVTCISNKPEYRLCVKAQEKI